MMTAKVRFSYILSKQINNNTNKEIKTPLSQVPKQEHLFLNSIKEKRLIHKSMLCKADKGTQLFIVQITRLK